MRHGSGHLEEPPGGGQARVQSPLLSPIPSDSREVPMPARGPDRDASCPAGMLGEASQAVFHARSGELLSPLGLVFFTDNRE